MWSFKLPEWENWNSECPSLKTEVTTGSITRNTIKLGHFWQSYNFELLNLKKAVGQNMMC
jgi:hypothetical protein